LAGVSDSSLLNQYVATKRKDNDLFETVLNVSESKIDAQTYKKRAQIMIGFFKKQPQNSIENVDCSCNVVSLANFIFKATPSFKEISICPSGCKPRITELPTITLTARELIEGLGNAIQQHVALEGSRCPQDGCANIRINRIHDIGKCKTIFSFKYSTDFKYVLIFPGDLVLIGLDIDHPLVISAIPEKFQNPKDGENYCLIGFIDFVGPPVTTRMNNTVSHYKAFCRRRTTWTVYDDLLKNHMLQNNWPK